MAFRGQGRFVTALAGLVLVATVSLVGSVICIAILNRGFTHLHDQWHEERQAALMASQRLRALEATAVDVQRQMEAMEPWVRMWARREQEASR